MSAAEIAQRTAEFVSLEYGLAARSLAACVLVGALCALAGTFLVARRLSLLGDAAGHATLPGICAAFLATGGVASAGLLPGALAAALFGALAIEWIARRSGGRTDAAIGVVLSVMFGVGITMLSYIQRTATVSYAGIDAMLFGEAAATSPGQLGALLGCAASVCALVAVFWRPLSLTVFDPYYARASGVPVVWVDRALLLVVAAVAVVSLQVVGVVLVSAALIIPASAALLIGRRLASTLALAVALGTGAGVVGAWASFVWEGVATGPAMVVAAVAPFALLIVTPRIGRGGARAREAAR